MSVSVVTGGSRGIGRAIALAFADAGSDIIAIARDATRLDELGEQVRARGGDFLGLSIDLEDTDGPLRAAHAAWEWRGDVSTLINAAGLLIRSPNGSVDLANEWDRTSALNVRAPLVLMDSLGGLMAENNGGSIVNVASLAGEVVTRAPAPYQATKAGLIQLTRYYAVRLAPSVRVNAVGPGYVRTDLTALWLATDDNERWTRDHTLLDRVGVPADIVGPVVFLASEAASYITGQHLLVDGGWSVV